MSQANEIETVESPPPLNLRREAAALLAADARSSRVLLRIPDCTARLSTVGGEGVSWWSKLQSFSQLAGPWLDVVRPVAPPRVLAAGAIGILLGIVMILLTPAEKSIPSIGSHRDQAAAGQRVMTPPPADEADGPQPNVGTTVTESAAKMALRPNAAATGDRPQLQYDGIRRPDNAPAAAGKNQAWLPGTIEKIH